jgi:hypothetical protein
MTASRITDATWTAFTESIRFVVVPIMLVNLVTTNYPSLKTAFMPNLATYILMIGGMIVVASTLECANKPGTYKRMLFGLSAVAFVCFWTFVLFGGGVAEFSYPPYYVRFDMSKILYIVLLGIALKALLVVQTFKSNKHLVVEEQVRRKTEKVVKVAPSAPRRRPASRAPSFASLSKAAFRVTSDDEVGYEPLPAPPSKEAVQDYKECPVCGVKASLRETTCKHCGAWFSGPFK